MAIGKNSIGRSVQFAVRQVNYMRASHTTRTAAAFVATALVASLANAQSTAHTGPTPRSLPAPAVTSPRFAGSAFSVIALSNGNLLVNDTRNHRVMLSDSLMRVTSVVIDSTEYGARPASILRYPGDSVMFVEAVTPSMTLIDPAGKVVRSMAVPRPRDVNLLMPTPGNFVGIDSRGRFVHRGFPPRVSLPKVKPNETRATFASDTTAIVRDDPVTRAADTLAWIRSYTMKSVEIGLVDGRTTGYTRQHPVDVVDEWAVLANGNIAVVRGRDYHIDLIDVDGRITSLPKIPYDWKHLSDDAKIALADSANTKFYDELQAFTKGAGGGTALNGGGAGAGGGMGSGGRGATNRPPPPPGSLDFKPTEIPDYRAVFVDGAVRADAEGNVWIRTQHPPGDTAKSVHDVVDGTGKLIDRVLVPNNRTIAGFDRRGNVFLVGKAEGGIQWIERVRWRN